MLFSVMFMPRLAGALGTPIAPICLDDANAAALVSTGVAARLR